MDKLIFKSSFWLLSANVLVKIVAFFYSIFLARSLGVEDFGRFVLALSYFSLAAAIADLGISRYIMREVQKGQENTAGLLFNSIITRSAILLAFVILFSLGISISDPDIPRRNLSLLAMLAVLPLSISLTLDSAYLAFFKAKISAMGILFLSILTTLFGVFLINLGFGVWGVVISLILGQFFYTTFLIVLSFFQKVDWVGVISVKTIKKLLYGSLPYGLLGVLGLLYFKVDTIFLSYFRGNFETGIYGAAYKFLEAIVFIPATLATVTFPVLAKLQGRDPGAIKKIYHKNLLLMVFVGIIFSLGFIFVLPVVIKFALPSYILAIPTVKILALAIPFMFFHVPAAQVLLSSEKYLKPIVLISFVPLIVNVSLNLIFIPYYGYRAAAWITVISDILSALILFSFIQLVFFKGKG